MGEWNTLIRYGIWIDCLQPDEYTIRVECDNQVLRENQI
jgi:hypothetical protein